MFQQIWKFLMRNLSIYVLYKANFISQERDKNFHSKLFHVARKFLESVDRDDISTKINNIQINYKPHLYPIPFSPSELSSSPTIKETWLTIGKMARTLPQQLIFPGDLLNSHLTATALANILSQFQGWENFRGRQHSKRFLTVSCLSEMVVVENRGWDYMDWRM